MFQLILQNQAGWHKLWKAGMRPVRIFPIYEDFWGFLWSQRLKVRPAIGGEKAVLSPQIQDQVRLWGFPARDLCHRACCNYHICDDDAWLVLCVFWAVRSRVVHYQPLSLFARAGNTSGVDNHHHDDHKAHLAHQDDHADHYDLDELGHNDHYLPLFLSACLETHQMLMITTLCSSR